MIEFAIESNKMTIITKIGYIRSQIFVIFVFRIYNVAGSAFAFSASYSLAQALDLGPAQGLAYVCSHVCTLLSLDSVCALESVHTVPEFQALV